MATRDCIRVGLSGLEKGHLLTYQLGLGCKIRIVLIQYVMYTSPVSQQYPTKPILLKLNRLLVIQTHRYFI